MKIFAFVTDGIVQNCVQAGDPPDAVWYELTLAKYDAVVDVTDLERYPGIGWSYDGTTFTAPEEPLA